MPAARETRKSRKGKKPQRQEHGTRRAGRCPTPASPSKKPVVLPREVVMVRCSPRDGSGNRKQEVLGIRVGRLGRSSSWAACTTLTCLPGLVRSRLLRGHRLRTSRLSREEETAGARAGRKCPHRAPGAVRRVTVGSVPASKMAAAAAAMSGALGRAGWRLLQLRCLPGEGTAEPGSVVGEGEGTKPTGLGTGGKRSSWRPAIKVT